MRGVIRFLQADEILGYLAEEPSSRVELFCCTTMHVRILPGRHKPCYVSNSVGTYLSILRTVRTWDRRTFSCFQKTKERLAGKRVRNYEDLRMLSAATWYKEGRLRTNWCQVLQVSLNQTKESKNCIYNILCEWWKRFIEETCRPLQTRVNEHEWNTTNGEIDKSKIAEHSWEQKHRFQWNKASIINKEENSRIRKLKESAFIHCTGPRN